MIVQHTLATYIHDISVLHDVTRYRCTRTHRPIGHDDVVERSLTVVDQSVDRRREVVGASVRTNRRRAADALVEMDVNRRTTHRVDASNLTRRLNVNFL